MIFLLSVTLLVASAAGYGGNCSFFLSFFHTDLFIWVASSVSCHLCSRRGGEGYIYFYADPVCVGI